MVVGATSIGFITKTFTVVKGATYRVSFRAAADRENVPLSAAAVMGSSNLAGWLNQVPIGTTEKRLEYIFTMPITASQNTIVLSFVAYQNSAVVYLDDIRLDRIDNQQVQIVSLKDYYPFGAVMKGRSYTASGGKYRYGFNGKEYDEESEYSDFGARLYDAGLGRFNSADPIAYAYPSHSAYNTCHNNPVVFIDYEGYGPELPANLKGTGNIVFVNDSPEELESGDYRNTGRWDVIVVENFSDIGNLAKQYSQKYGKINNVWVSMHGYYGILGPYDDPEESRDKDGIYRLGESSFDEYGKNGNDGTKVSDLLESIKDLGESLAEESDVYFGSCLTASNKKEKGNPNSETPRKLHSLLTKGGNEVNLFTNYEMGRSHRKVIRTINNGSTYSKVKVREFLNFNKKMYGRNNGFPTEYSGIRLTNKYFDGALGKGLRVAKRGYFYFVGNGQKKNVNLKNNGYKMYKNGQYNTRFKNRNKYK